MPGESRSSSGSWFDRDWLWVCLHLLVFLVPLATSNLTWLRVLPGVEPITAFTADQFDIVKVVVMRALALVALGIWGWRLLTRGGEVRRTRADWLILGFLAWVLVTTLLSVHVPTAVFGKYRRFEGLLSFVTYGTVFFLTVQAAQTAGRRRSLARTLFVSSTLVATYGLLQYAGLDPALWGETVFGSNRGFSTFGNPNFLGGFLVLTIPVSAALALSEDDHRWRAVYWTGFLLMVGGWVTAFTRGAWIAGVLALLILGVAALRRRLQPRRVDWAFLAVATAGGVAVVLRSLSSADEVTNVGSRLRSMFVFTEGSGYTRGLIWRTALDAIKDRPVWGHGADTFRLLFPKYKPEAYVQTVGLREVADNAHNYPLQLASTIGIVGATLFYCVFGWILWLAAPRAFSRERDGDSLLSAGMWAAAAGYTVHLFFGISVTGSTVILWVLFALLLAPLATTSSVERPSWGTIGVVILVPIVALALLGNLTQLAADHFFVRGGTAETSAEKVQAVERAIRWNPFNDQYRSDLGFRTMTVMAERINRASAEQQAGQDPTASIEGARDAFLKAEQVFEAAIDHSPLEYDNYAALSQAYTWAMDLDPAYADDAIRVATAGIEVSPNGPAVHATLAAALLRKGDLAGAEAAAQRAAYLDPRYGEPRGLLGDIYGRMGRLEEARAQYQAALVLDPQDAQAGAGLARIEAQLQAVDPTSEAGG